MFVAVEMRAKYGRRVWANPQQQLEGLRRIARIAGAALVSFCLMTTHFHLVLEVDDPTALLARIARAIDSDAEERGCVTLDAPHVQVLADEHAVVRYTAYAHANPVDAQMVNDPIAWPFSSHRDVCGLRTASWYRPRGPLAQPPLDVLRWLNEKAKSRLPLPLLGEPSPQDWPDESLALLRRAVASVFGSTEDELRHRSKGLAARRCLSTLADFEGWRPTEIAEHMGWSDRHQRRMELEVTPAVRAALFVVRDPRLRPSRSDWWDVPADARGPNLWADWRDTTKVRPVGHSRPER